ncbi:hypothetical protein BDN67DRAFT_963000 [Paxillus ammoniavirescens]|nr:hypothetical protein BDN67DRAFT_963000 [Paxillus ammoniavirescens]
MSSYAKVAAHNAPSPSRQPHPSPALLTTDEKPATVSEVDDAAKVGVISGDFRDGSTTYASETVVRDESEVDLTSPGEKARGGRSRRLQEAALEVNYLWQLTKQCLLRPGVAGGLVGLVNVGLLSGAGYALYTKPHLRGDKTAISSAVGGALLLLGAEGYAVEKYRKTSYGKEEERQDGTLVHQRIREQILRPGVLSNTVGLINAGIIGLVGYFSYINWDKPRWDRNIVMAVSVGLLTLWRGESYLSRRCRGGHKR